MNILSEVTKEEVDSIRISTHGLHGENSYFKPEYVRRISESWLSQRELLEEMLALMPAAANCPEPGSNVVNYTDKEWIRIVNATNKARALVSK